jgi:hypothetical protein
VAYAAGIAGVDLEGGSGNHRRGGVQACATVKGNSVIQHDRSQQNFLSSDILEPFVAAASSSIVQSGLASVGAQQGWQTAAEAGLNAPVTASLGAAEAVGAAAAGTYLLPAAVGAAVASYGLYKLATNPTADNMLPARNDEMQNTFGQNVVAPYTYKRQAATAATAAAAATATTATTTPAAAGGGDKDSAGSIGRTRRRQQKRRGWRAMPPEQWALTRTEVSTPTHTHPHPHTHTHTHTHTHARARPPAVSTAGAARDVAPHSHTHSHTHVG